jgi:lysophospholipase L1-like esterase
MNPLVSHGEGANFDFTINKVNHYLKDYRKAIADVASTKGAILFNTEQLSGLNPSNSAISKNFYLNKQDGVHPNPEGHKRIAIPLINLLEDLVY